MPNSQIRTGTTIRCGACPAMVYVEPNQAGRKKFCSKACFYRGRALKGLFQKGHGDLVPASSRGHSPDTIAKIAATCRERAIYGPQHFNYRGGLRAERKKAMNSWQYREWRMAVFKRDSFTCQGCGARGVFLNADHIKPWATHPELRFEVSNGRALCVPCHLKTPTHGAKALSFAEVSP